MKEESEINDGRMPLNKFISHSGYCSRRDAVELVKKGRVTVNGIKVIEPGFKVTLEDQVAVNGKKVFKTKELVYILLNKPVNVVTTTNDPQKRKKVTDLIKKATKQRVYPIGRLDYETTGVLLLTNDGELTQRLAHPKYEVRKTYVAILNKPLKQEHFEKIMAGCRLEDCTITPDKLEYLDKENKAIIKIQLHSGRNRIVRRIFEHVGYVVLKLDRTKFAELDKNGVKVGNWRYLTPTEIKKLKSK